MALVNLTKGQKMIVDPIDYQYLKDVKCFCASRSRSGGFYAATCFKKNGAYKTILVHRLIMGASVGQIVDHINGDTLDNRRSNLQFLTNRQNILKGRPRKNKYDLPGIYYDNRSKRYGARIRIGSGKRISLGYFDTKNDASKIYTESLKKYWTT